MISSAETSKKGYVIYKLGASNVWTTLLNTPTNAKSIGVDNVGQVWMSNLNGKIYSHAGRSDWIEQEGDANDLTISSGNVVWTLNAYGQPIQLSNVYEKIYL
jgi:hypothetical protein